MENEQVYRERLFHDRRFERPSIRSRRVERFYSITEEIYERLHSYLIENAKRKRVLECGCGLGDNTRGLFESRATLLGIDISEVALHQASDDVFPGSPRLQFSLMDVQRLALVSDSFDLAYGTGILHHVQLEDAMKELCRVLTPEGQAVFVEPLGHNPLLNTYRLLTPRIRSADEHPLLISDLALLSRYFDEVRLDFYYLVSLAAVPFLGFPGGNFLLSRLQRLDEQLTAIPLLRRYAWMVYIQLGSPLSL